jgi:ribosomal protein L37AE/L43A
VAPAAPGVLTTLLCERCGNEQLIRVKGCWYCEKCHYKFDCFGV